LKQRTKRGWYGGGGPASAPRTAAHGFCAAAGATESGESSRALHARNKQGGRIAVVRGNATPRQGRHARSRFRKGTAGA
jgi:hypothetical protein